MTKQKIVSSIKQIPMKLSFVPFAVILKLLQGMEKNK